MDAEAAIAIGDSLAVRYGAVAAGPMRDMPLCNAALRVAAIGFRPLGDNAVGIVVTPWFMNVVVAGPGAAAVAPGSNLRLALPSGAVDFVTGALEGFGPLLSCSLFSPMFDFADMESAEVAAREAMRALFDPALLDPPAPPPRDRLDRRALLLGRREAQP